MPDMRKLQTGTGYPVSRTLHGPKQGQHLHNSDVVMQCHREDDCSGSLPTVRMPRTFPWSSSLTIFPAGMVWPRERQHGCAWQHRENGKGQQEQDCESSTLPHLFHLFHLLHHFMIAKTVPADTARS